MILDEQFQAYFPEQAERYAFLEWAFGEAFKEVSKPVAYIECWNYHHEKECPFSLKGDIFEDAPKMIKMWREKK